jgi:1-aminocyclopropane-1-carboxylate deaminase/D-cysteine desulfhydrase-like pyridoxal-dependent ACC family enzyme
MADRDGSLTFARGRHADDPNLDEVSRILVTGGGTSIFDPVLTELVYRWFCPPGGAVLDPFAGGSVRGVVAAKLGRRYTGIELRGAQVEANREQWDWIGAGHGVSPLEPTTDDPMALTPVQVLGDIWVKRDDLFAVNGVPGGKVRTCLALARAALAEGKAGLVTAGSRSSPQVNIVSHIAAHLGLPARCHTPSGELSPEVAAAADAGAEIVQHRAGYNNVIIARAREDASSLGWAEIPFGMECAEAVAQTRRQAANLPDGARRLVVPVGSGMSLAGILWGLEDAGRLDLPVIGVRVGADPTERLDSYAPRGWRERVTLITSELDYHEEASDDYLGSILLDQFYEAKCVPYLEPGDVFWIVGIRQSRQQAQGTSPFADGADGDYPPPTWIEGDSLEMERLLPTGYGADLVFSCPPYADLEVYSDDPLDISTMEYPEFLAAYRRIIAEACNCLSDNRFACFVVGEVRGKNGAYYGFVPDTIRAFTDAGMSYYNEIILVTSVGSLPVRAGQAFAASRKIGKTHQNVLVFVKGDPKKATAAVGEVEFATGEDLIVEE